MPDGSECPVCGESRGEPFGAARDIEYFTSDRRWEYRICKQCDVVFLVDPPVDRLAEIYPTNYYSFDGGEDSLALRVKARMDERWLRRVLAGIEGSRLAVLDVGGGAGELLTIARRVDGRVARTVEIDIDPQAEARAVAAGHRFVRSRIEDLETDETFDLVLMLNLLEHVADPRFVLTKVKSLLAPAGQVVIKTPNFRTLDCRLFRHRNWGGFHAPRHFVLFTAASLRQLAAQCGLSSAIIRYTQGAPQWTVSLLGLLLDRGWIRADTERPLHRHPLYGPVAMATAAFDFVRIPVSRTAQMTALLRRV